MPSPPVFRLSLFRNPPVLSCLSHTLRPFAYPRASLRPFTLSHLLTLSRDSPTPSPRTSSSLPADLCQKIHMKSHQFIAFILKHFLTVSKLWQRCDGMSSTRGSGIYFLLQFMKNKSHCDGYKCVVCTPNPVDMSMH